MEKLLAYASSHMFVYFVFLLAVNFFFSNTKMLKLLFILLVIKQFLGNVTSGIDIYSAKAKYYPIRESWVVVIQIETLHTLSVLIFAYIYFCELKKSYFARTYFWEWTVFENFEVINFSSKEKRIRKRQLNQEIFGLFFCQDQRKDWQVTMEKLLLRIDFKEKLN